MLFNAVAFAEARRRFGSQKALANKTEYTTAYISQLENGVRDQPSEDFLNSAAEAMGVEAREFYVEPSTAQLAKEWTLALARERREEGAA